MYMNMLAEMVIALMVQVGSSIVSMYYVCIANVEIFIST